MRTIDLEHWPRRPHFELFRSYELPHLAVTAPVDVTALKAGAARRGLSLFHALVWAATRAANEVPELRQRIRGKTVVEHDRVHPSFTAAGPDETFLWCHARWDPDPRGFAAAALAAERAAAARDPLAEETGDDLLFVTSLPWLSFTALQHPMRVPGDCVPRIAWGRLERVADRDRLPLALQAHHALVDGLHVARFFRQFDEAVAALAAP